MNALCMRFDIYMYDHDDALNTPPSDAIYVRSPCTLHLIYRHSLHLTDLLAIGGVPLFLALFVLYELRSNMLLLQ